MPTWSGVLKELQESAAANNGQTQIDVVRRKYLSLLQSHTKRTTILYATRFLSNDTPSPLLSIGPEDLQGIMEVVHGTKSRNLDLILHSPGGSADSAETIVKYLRSKFKHIRVIVPLYAFSAATMMACAADEIVMGKHSFLGPIDPQIFIKKEHDGRYVPAQSILDQFDLALEACQDPKNLPAWVPMLREYGPYLLVLCENAKRLATELVTEWLHDYMMKRDPDKKRKSEKVATWLADHGHHKSHGRPISRSELKKRGLNITFLENDQNLQELVLSVMHSTTHTFDMTAAAKIIENHLGKAFIKIRQMAMQPFQLPTGIPFPQMPPQVPGKIVFPIHPSQPQQPNGSAQEKPAPAPPAPAPKQ